MGEEEKKQLILLGSEIQSRDYIPAEDLENKRFTDLVDFLYKKYEEPILSHVREALSNIVARRDRIPIKFQYADPSGTMITIDPSDEVLSIMELSNTVHWTVETFGG